MAISFDEPILPVELGRYLGGVLRDHEEQDCQGLRNTLLLAAESDDLLLAQSVIPISRQAFGELKTVCSQYFCYICGKPARGISYDYTYLVDVCGIIRDTVAGMQYPWCLEHFRDGETQTINLGPTLSHICK